MKTVKNYLVLAAIALLSFSFGSCTDEKIVVETVVETEVVTEIVEVQQDLFLDTNVIGKWQSRRSNRRYTVLTFNYDGTWTQEEFYRNELESKVKRNWEWEFEGMLNLGYISSPYRVFRNGRKLEVLGTEFNRRQL